MKKITTLFAATLVLFVGLFGFLSSYDCGSFSLRGNNDKGVAKLEQYSKEAELLFPMRQLGSNPTCTLERRCQRHWYCLWICERCTTQKSCCYGVHRYWWRCFGLVSLERLYYIAVDCVIQPELNYEYECDEKNIDIFRPCFGVYFKERCVDKYGLESNVCPKDFGFTGFVPGVIKQVCRWE